MVEVNTVRETAQTNNEVLNPMTAMGHEQLVFCQDQATGLKAIIAIHNTVLGPALGGTRMWKYATEAEALNDVLRLSRGMTYKAAISGLNLGGGKAVIIGDSRTEKTEASMRRFGKFVDSLSGKYITAEDVGMTTKDMEYIHMETNHVAGKPEAYGGGGDPSPVTAYGVYMGMKASAHQLWGNDSLEGKTVVVQGAGNVGRNLIGYLNQEKANVLVSDIFEDKLKQVTSEYKVKVIDPADVYDVPMDVYAPCALGATVNTDTLNRLKCSIIAGAANNQLADEKLHGEMVMRKGMVYAPDFLINAGGLINCYSEVHGSYNRKMALTQAENIYNTTLEILKLSQQKNIPSYQAANSLAEQRIEAIGKIKLSR